MTQRDPEIPELFVEQLALDELAPGRADALRRLPGTDERLRAKTGRT